MDAASGDIITFIDRADYIAEHYYELLAEKFNSSNADVVFFEFDRINQNNRNAQSAHRLPSLTANYQKSLCRLSKKYLFGYTGTKAFQAQLIREKRLHNDLRLFEDEVFTCEVLASPCCIETVPEVLYPYVRSENTLATRIHETDDRNWDAVYSSWKLFLSDCSENADFLRMKRKTSRIW